MKDHYDVPYSDGIMHEFIISGVKQKKRGIKVLDIAKALLDEGYHSPTIYFPINVPEAIMIEPTESENIDTLNEFSDCMIHIDKLIDLDPDIKMKELFQHSKTLIIGYIKIIGIWPTLRLKKTKVVI